MKTDHCEQIMDAYLALDKNERIPFTLTLHLLTCKHCRTQVRLLTRAQKIAARPLAVQTPLSDAGIQRIMQAVDPTWTETKAKPVSLTNWIFGGILMIVFMLVFGAFRNSLESDALTLAFYLFFACAVTAYCVLFVGTNLDFFIKKIQTMQTA